VKRPKLSEFKYGWKFVAGIAVIKIVKRVRNPMTQVTKEWLLSNYNDNYSHKHSGACRIDKVTNRLGFTIWDRKSESL